VIGTSDAGASSIMLGVLDSAVALSFETPDDDVSAATQEDCDAAVRRTADGGTCWEQAFCLKGCAPQAVAAVGDTVVAQAGTGCRSAPTQAAPGTAFAARACQG
jgi:hypothetical protein